MSPLSCACGLSKFRVRVDGNQQVGLVTCEAGHASLLLDSADYWGDVIQDGRPPEKKCRCGSRLWTVSLSYDLREDGKTVREVQVELTCAGCGSAKRPIVFEIDYEPTDLLVDAPLSPCADPWLKAKRVVITALWKPADLQAFVKEAARHPGAAVHLARWREAPSRLEDIALLTELVTSQSSFDLLMTNVPVAFPENLRDCWKVLPVVQIGSPTAINYSTGMGLLYYVEYAEEIFDGPRARSQPEAFLEYARALRRWLSESFCASRGKDTADNPEEVARLRGGW